MATNMEQKLWDAAFMLDLDTIKKLLKQGASLSKSDKNECDALYHAINCLWQYDDPETAPRQKAIIEFLIKQGVDIEKRYAFVSGQSPLMMAASGGKTGALEALIKAGADIESVDKYNFTPLMRAALGGYAQALKILLAAGADVNKKSGKSDALTLAQKGKKEDSGQTGSDFKATIELLGKHFTKGKKPVDAKKNKKN